jgi:hypothetical protein
MRPRILRAIVIGWLFCLALLVIPFQPETRYVGLAGVVIFTAMYFGERRRPTPRGPSSGGRGDELRLPFLVHGSRR